MRADIHDGQGEKRSLQRAYRCARQSSPDRHIRLAPHGRSIQKYMARGRAPPSQGWKTFLRNHADGIAAMDLFVVSTLSFRLLYGLLIMGHGRGQILWLGV